MTAIALDGNRYSGKPSRTVSQGAERVLFNRIHATWIIQVAPSLALATALVLAGCARPRMELLTDKDYPPRPPSFEMPLYEGEVQTPHEVIAYLDSAWVEDVTTSTKTLMIEDLQKRARRVGADAVMNVRMLTGSVRGWVPDPQTPFRSFRQGWKDRYFLRGEAVRFKPLLIETGEDPVVGDPFLFGEGERPQSWSQSPDDELEVYETIDEQGRRGFASRKKSPTPAPRSLQIEP
jgi:hypothetical protein